jgi:hypothetical protein
MAAEGSRRAAVAAEHPSITGPQGLGKGLEDWFGRHRIRRSAGSINAELMAGDASAGAARLAAIMSEAVGIIAKARSLAVEDARPVSVLIAIDQGEELFAAEDAVESERFIATLGQLLAHPPEGLDPFAVITIRADSVEPLLQRVPQLGLDAPHVWPLPPLSPSAYRDVITRPAAVYSRRTPLAVGRFEVTFDEWDGCVAHGGCPVEGVAAANFGRGRQPVINVSWDDAKKYVVWLSKRTGKTYRLLTEAKWEYAARAGTTGRFSFSDDDKALREHALFSRNSESRTHVVEGRKANPFGLHGDARALGTQAARPT